MSWSEDRSPEGPAELRDAIADWLNSPIRVGAVSSAQGSAGGAHTNDVATEGGAGLPGFDQSWLSGLDWLIGGGTSSPSPVPTSSAPDQIAGLSLWLDAADAASVLDGNGDGGIDRWLDRSGSGHHAAPATTQNQPSSRIGLSFDGTNDALRIGGSAWSGSPSVLGTLTIAFTTGEDVSATETIYTGSSAIRGVDVKLGGGKLFVGGWNSFGWGVSRYVDTPVEAETQYAVSLVFHDGAMEIFLDGTSLGLVADISPLSASGDVMYVGTDGRGSGHFSGFIDEIVAFDRALDAAERQALETHLSDKWSAAYANQAPVVADDAAATSEDGTITIAVLGNDSDVDEDALSVTGLSEFDVLAGQQIQLASGAVVRLNDDGTLTYDPNGAFAHLRLGQTDTDSFSYTVSDGRGGLETASVTVTVSGSATYFENDLLLSDLQRWNAGDPLGTPATVTYAFLDASPEYYAESHWAWNDFKAFTATQEGATRSILAHIESFANIDFVETAAADAAMTFGNARMTSELGGFAYFPRDPGVGTFAGDVWMNVAFWGPVSAPVPGNWGWMALTHEIGHALGLGHPESLTGVEATRAYTVMAIDKSPYARGGAEPMTMQVYDMAALQGIYGSNDAFATGNDRYRLSGDEIGTIWDAGGTDTFDGSRLRGPAAIDLNPGGFSSVGGGTSNIAIALGTVIENAWGGRADDILIGNDVGNVLNGRQGNDSLTGAGGEDLFDFDRNWGADVITDFELGIDRADLRDTGLAFADLEISVFADRAVVAHDDDRITFLGVDALTEDDFVFTLIG